MKIKNLLSRFNEIFEDSAIVDEEVKETLFQMLIKYEPHFAELSNSVFTIRCDCFTIEFETTDKYTAHDIFERCSRFYNEHVLPWVASLQMV